MAHNYVRNIAELADETGRPVIHYDQIGCGNSTHLPDAPADFWTPELFVDEFHTVRDALGIEKYHLLGQSWGGMLGAEIAVRQPPGLRRWRSATPPRRWSCGWRAPPNCARSCRRRRRTRWTGTRRRTPSPTPEYLAATNEFYRRHLCRVEPMPQDLIDTMTQMESEPTVYYTMNGPNEFHVVGTLQRMEHHRPAATDHRAHAGDRRRVRRGDPRDLATVRRAHRRRPRATCSPIPVTAPTWRGPRSSAPSSPNSSPATTRPRARRSAHTDT